MAFIDQGEFEAMKSLSGWEAACSDEHQFCTKSTLAVSSYRRLTTKWCENTKNGTFATVDFNCVRTPAALRAIVA